MSKPKLQLYIRTADSLIETPLLVFDQRSWTGVRAAIRSRCLGGHSWSAYYLAGIWRPFSGLGTYRDNVRLNISVVHFNLPNQVVRIREDLDRGPFIGESQIDLQPGAKWDRIVKLILSTVES